MNRKKEFLKLLKGLQTKPENGSEYSKNQEPANGNASQEVPPANIPISTNGPLPTIETLIYWDFIQMMLGRIDKPANWDEIRAEFSEAIKTPKSSTIFDCWKKIESLTTKMNFVSLACNYLKHSYDTQIAEQLMLHGYDYVQDLPERDAYLKQIYLVETEAKTLVIILNQCYNEYRLLCPEGAGEDERTIVDYDKELAIISKFVGHRVNKFEITVSEFCAYANLYLEHG